MIFYYPPTAAMTRALKKRLRSDGLRYKVGYLGDLMEENFNEARRHGTLRYRPEHLKLLRGVNENPEVVDIAFEVLAERLEAKGIDLPADFDEQTPYDPDYSKLAMIALILAVAMTILITLAVVFVSNIAAMTTLIVLVSVVGAAVFVWGISKATIPVQPAA